MSRLLAAAPVLLLLAACHAGSGSDSGTTPGEADELNQAAASIDINSTAAQQSGGSQENGQ